MEMSVSEIFEKASRLKIRFDTPAGRFSVEDLWDLPLTSTGKVCLDSIALGLHRQIKNQPEVSFVGVREEDPKLQIQFELVMHVIKVRLEEKKQFENRRLKESKRQKLMELIARKEDASLEDKSVEELLQMVESL